jgi:hypothetical protein
LVYHVRFASPTVDSATAFSKEEKNREMLRDRNADAGYRHHNGERALVLPSPHQ